MIRRLCTVLTKGVRFLTFCENVYDKKLRNRICGKETGTSQVPPILQCFTGDKDSAEITTYVLLEIRYNVLYR